MTILKWAWPLLLISLTSLGAPTVESLFRNPSNKEVSTSGIYVTFLVSQRKDKDDLIEATGDTPSDYKRFLRVDFIKESETRLKVMQMIYNGDSTSLNNLVRVNEVRSISKRAKDQNVTDESVLFAGLLHSLILNESDGMSAFLKRVAPDYQANSELINAEKMALYEKQVKYLKKVKKNDSISTPSPLRPSDEEEVKKVKELLQAPMYKKSGHVALENVGGDFFWKIGLSTFSALFTNEERQLKKIVYKSGDKTFEISTGPYVLFDGIHELPNKIIIKTYDGYFYELKTLRLQPYNAQSKAVKKKLSTYLKKGRSLAKANRDVTPEASFFIQ